MSEPAVDNDSKLLRNSISIIEVIADCLFVFPLSTDATQISKRIWGMAQEMTSDRIDQSKTSQRTLEAMIAMIDAMQGGQDFESSQQLGELDRLVEDLEKVHAAIAMVSACGADDTGHIICRILAHTNASIFQFSFRGDEMEYDIGTIKRGFKTQPNTQSESVSLLPEISPEQLYDVNMSSPSEDMWDEADDIFAHDHYFYSSQDKKRSNISVPIVEFNMSSGSNWNLPDLTGKVTQVETRPAAQGMLADYWKGVWQHDSRIYKVAIKVIREVDKLNDANEGEKSVIDEAWRRDLCVWRRLRHERIIPLLGIMHQSGIQNCFVCPWTENGNLNNYLRNHSSSLKVSSDRFRMLCDISSGLAYLHSVSIIHGNLCGYRILIDSRGNAYISGFDCSTIMVEPGDLTPYNPYDGATIHFPWAAPELVVFEAGSAPIVSPQNDIFSFGRVMLQVLSDTIPFRDRPGGPFTYYKLANGIHPEIPSRPWITEDHRSFMLRCWADYGSGQRPDMAEVLVFINTESAKAREQEGAQETLIDFTGLLQRESQFPSAGGGFADIWKALWQRESMTYKVAVKVLRHHVDDEEARNKMNKRLRRELTVWQRLKHPNILPLYGVTSDFGFYPSLVCPWFENGNLNNYLERQGDGLSLHSKFKILCDVAAGLCHLHSFADPIIHGDLTGSNILIDANENACLCDFGLSTILAEFQGTSYFTSTISGSVRWAAPELYRVQDDVSTKGLSTASDIYSFGSVMLQTLSSQVPYYDLQNLQVLHRLIHNGHPERPSIVTVTDEYWSFIEWCWANNGRPSIEKVCLCISKFQRDLTNQPDSSLCDI